MLFAKMSFAAATEVELLWSSIFFTCVLSNIVKILKDYSAVAAEHYYDQAYVKERKALSTFQWSL